MSPPRRALISVTSAHATLFQGKETTGLFISEALHPYNVLTAAGFEVDLASETGSYTADWLSQQPDFLNGADLATWTDTDSDFRRKLDHMVPAAELDGSKYGVFYASAGHAALIDYPTAAGLQRIAEDVWASGGIVASVCHGPAIFANMIDRATGEPLIKGKAITGFTSEAEVEMKIMEELRSWNKELVEDLAARLGAKCKLPTHPPPPTRKANHVSDLWLMCNSSRRTCSWCLGRLQCCRWPLGHWSEPR
jgi:putative intracellular protease/amidase